MRFICILILFTKFDKILYTMFSLCFYRPFLNYYVEFELTLFVPFLVYVLRILPKFGRIDRTDSKVAIHKHLKSTISD